jgi:lysophospholipase L1-like esterase
MVARRRLLANFGTLLLVSAICLAALELAFRYYLFGSDGFTSRKPGSLVDIGVSGHIQLSPHPGVIYELQPNIDTYYFLADLKTNSRGLRDKEYSIEKPPGTYRVAVLGDSFTMPLGVELQDAYHSLLEERLNGVHPDRRYEFINFGVPGYSLRQYVNVLRHKALAYEPDAVLIGFCYLNDYHVPPEDKATEPFAIRAAERRMVRSFVLEQLDLLFTRLADKVTRRLKPQTADFATGGSAAPGCDDADVAYMKSMFSELRELTAARDIPVIIAGLELLDIQGPCAELAEELATMQDLYFVNAAGITSFAESHRYRIYPLDGHPNARAHEAFADRIMQFVESRRLFAN